MSPPSRRDFLRNAELRTLLGAARHMNESAGAEDEVTLGIVKEALAATRLDTYNILVRAWSVDETHEFEGLKSAFRSSACFGWTSTG